MGLPSPAAFWALTKTRPCREAFAEASLAHQRLVVLPRYHLEPA
jgi:hypothetical protein